MPRERKGISTRKSNIRSQNRFFVIASEGADTERIYFEALNREITNNTKLRTVRIEFLERGKGKNSKKAINDERSKSGHLHVIKQLDTYKKEYNLEKEDELWLIIDRDKNNNTVQNISNIAQKCNQKDYNLALSNPCFEFWLLLHLKNLDDYTPSQKSNIIQNQRISNGKAAPKFLEKELALLLGSGFTKSKFDTIPFMNTIDYAIQQAKNLDNEERWHENQLGTRVYRLVENILSRPT